MALVIASPTAGTLQIVGAVVIGTLDAGGNFIQYAAVAYKAPVRVATTANGTLATAFANGQNVDGITLATGDRILLKNQTASADNGIYVVAASGAPTRATNFNDWAEIPGAIIAVLVGTTNADTAWLCTSDAGGSLGTTPIVFTQFGAGVVFPITASQGGTGIANNVASTLTISGNFGTTFTITGTTSVTLPTSGTLATTAQLLAVDTGWTANADNGDKTVVIGSTATLDTIATALNIVTAGAGTQLENIAQKVKALEAALVANKRPNA